MRLPHFRLWMLMALVFVAGLGMGVIATRKRAEFLEAKAASYRANADRHVLMADRHALMITEQPERWEFHWKRSGYHVRLVQKYERAAAKPWEPVPYDPPPP